MIHWSDRFLFTLTMIVAIVGFSMSPWLPGSTSSFVVVQAGNRACDPRQGAPCDMDSCNRMAKGQQWCSPKCHKDCCKCPAECNGHNPEPTPSPDPEGSPEAVLRMTMKDCVNYN